MPPMYYTLDVRCVCVLFYFLPQIVLSWQSLCYLSPDGENHPGPSFKHALMYGTYFVAIIVPLLLVVYGFYQMYSYLLLPDRV